MSLSSLGRELQSRLNVLMFQGHSNHEESAPTSQQHVDSSSTLCETTNADTTHPSLINVAQQTSFQQVSSPDEPINKEQVVNHEGIPQTSSEFSARSIQNASTSTTNPSNNTQLHESGSSPLLLYSSTSSSCSIIEDVNGQQEDEEEKPPSEEDLLHASYLNFPSTNIFTSKSIDFHRRRYSFNPMDHHEHQTMHHHVGNANRVMNHVIKEADIGEDIKEEEIDVTCISGLKIHLNKFKFP